MTTRVDRLLVQAELPPVRVDDTGTVRVGGTRITLDLIVSHYESGMTPEEIVRACDALALPDVYAAIAWYLRHRDQVAVYLQQRDEQAQALQTKIETETPPVTRDELLARTKANASAGQ